MAKKSVGVKPLGDRLLVEPVVDGVQMKGSLFLPESAQEKPQTARVIALGTGKADKKGDKIPFEVAVGDEVLYSKYGGTDVKVDGKEYLMMSQSDILAVIK